MIKPARPQGFGKFTEGISAPSVVSEVCGLLPGQLRGVLGASDVVDAPLLDRWPETDQALPKRRRLASPPNR